MSLRVLFDGTGSEKERPASAVQIQSLSQKLKANDHELREWPVDDIISLLCAASKKWAGPDFPLRTALSHQGLPFLIAWLREGHLRRIADLSLRGNRLCLNQPVRLEPSSPVLYRAMPHGLTVHWIAGNVPILGFISLAQALITKNAVLIKAPSSSRDILPELLRSLVGVEIKGSEGKIRHGSELLGAAAVVHFDSGNASLGEALSRCADLRIVWGGLEAVEAIQALPKRSEIQDLVFGPKYSYSVIGREALSSATAARDLAARCAVDIAIFDQYACSSPHTIFVEEDGAVEPEKFARFLADSLAETGKRIPKTPVDPGKASEILKWRSLYDLRHKAFYPKGTEWTVLFSDEKNLADPCFSRVAFVRQVPDIMESALLASANTQTIGTALSKNRRVEFLEKAGASGALRLPQIGSMSAFATPWDGMFPMDRMVRWVTTYDD